MYVGMRYWHPFTEEAIEQVSINILVFDIPCGRNLISLKLNNWSGSCMLKGFFKISQSVRLPGMVESVDIVADFGTILQIKRDGITKLVVLPLYPQFSISTSGSSLRLLESIFR